MENATNKIVLAGDSLRSYVLAQVESLTAEEKRELLEMVKQNMCVESAS